MVMHARRDEAETAEQRFERLVEKKAQQVGSLWIAPTLTLSAALEYALRARFPESRSIPKMVRDARHKVAAMIVQAETAAKMGAKAAAKAPAPLSPSHARMMAETAFLMAQGPAPRSAPPPETGGNLAGAFRALSADPPAPPREAPELAGTGFKVPGPLRAALPTGDVVDVPPAPPPQPEPEPEPPARAFDPNAITSADCKEIRKRLYAGEDPRVVAKGLGLPMRTLNRIWEGTFRPVDGRR
jgi:hypothetical protein